MTLRWQLQVVTAVTGSRWQLVAVGGNWWQLVAADAIPTLLLRVPERVLVREREPSRLLAAPAVWSISLQYRVFRG